MTFKVWILNSDTRERSSRAVESEILLTPKQVIVYGNPDYEFSEEESVFMDNAVVTHSPVQIHKDDSIEQLKKKIVNETGANYAEIYTFCYKNTKLNLLNALMSSTKSVIDAQILQAFLTNIDMDGLNPDMSKSVFEYKYLVSRGFNQEYNLDIKTSLGIEFKRQPNYLFSVNPFQLGAIFEGIENSLILNEARLIGNIVDNNIYVCMASDLDINESIVRIYYPHLADENIFNSADLQAAKELLKSKTSEIMKEGTFSTYKSIDTMYSLYYNRDRELGAQKGITQLNISIVPPFNLIMPLDAIFKNIHCDATYPFIKYNPGIRREKLYRLYSTQISKTGKKIPYLSKAKIVSLARTTSTHKQISVYNAPNNLIISIEANGTIGIQGKFANAKQVGEIEQFLKTSVNPVIDKINNYLLSSGYRISYMERIDGHNIKISSMNYEFICPMKKRVNLRNTCVYSVFDVLEADIKKGGLLRFKRVDNFQKMDALNAFIHDYVKKRGELNDAVDALVKNYGIDTKQAMKLVSDADVPVNKNPGFITQLRVENNLLYIQVLDLDNIMYVETLGIYLDSMCRIIQDGTKECLAPEAPSVPFVSREPLVPLDSRAPLAAVGPSVLNAPVGNKVPLEVSYNATATEEPAYDVNDDINAQIQQLLQAKLAEQPEEKAEVVVKPVVVPGLDLFGDEEDEEYMGGKTKGGASDDEDDDDDDSSKIGKRFFLKRLMKADPVLFKEVNKKDGKVERYTRACPSMQQPVVISNDEKEKIDATNRNSYENAIQYGSDENKKNNNWYICPRFWCFKPGKYKNTSMTDEDVKAGKCGKTEEEQKKYVFEFNNKKDHIGKDGKYRNFNPSFITKLHSNKNLCLPCCYAEWDSNMHQKRRRQCLEGEAEESEAKQKKVVSNEIMAHNKVLTPGRWGYLPFSIQYFMQIKQKDQESFMFLRYGVESKQSLVATLADVYGRLNKISVPSVQEMRELIVKSFDEQAFAKFGNGSFASTFSKGTSFPTGSNKKTNAYKNFCDYLLNTEDELDYTYLWDIVCTPNSKLFKGGLNLIIMDIVNNDVTDKVDLVCPSTSYVATRYNKTRDSLFLISTESKYEPVYLVFNPKKDKTVIPVFRPASKISNITNVLNLIDKTLNKYCSASRKVPQEYYKTFNAPMELQQLRDELAKLNSKGYKATKQILNYNERVIGLTVETPQNVNIVLYTEPSAQLDNFESVYMDEQSLWLDYATTREILLEIKEANPNILCKPLVKVFENGQVVGFLTETNQFIKFSEPADNEDDNIMSVHEKHHLLHNPKQIPTAISEVLEKAKGPDGKRNYTVRNIGLESDFFVLYRSTLKTLLENRDSRNSMIALLDRDDLLYEEKLEKVATMVKDITENAVQYARLTESVLNAMTMVSYTCSSNGSSNDIEKTSGIFKDGCKLIVPEKNLVSGKLNSTVYPYRVADELIRFGRIKNYILNSNQFLNMGNTEFKLNTNEYIVQESALLKKEYFDDMVPNKSSVGIIHDIAKTQLYAPPFIELEKQAEPIQQNNVVCNKIEPHRKNINNNYWVAEAFPDKLKTMQIEFKDTPECSFGPLIHIMTHIRGTPLTIGEIKTMLWAAYQELTSVELQKMQMLLKKEGKKQMLEDTPDFEIVFKSDAYNLTTADVWLFAEKYEVPIILFSSSIYLHDVLIIQESESKQYNKKYDIYRIQKVKPHALTHSWIQLGPTTRDSAYWFYESAAEVRGYDKINKNVIIEKAYREDELRNFTQELLSRTKRITLREHLASL
jgi:hypothetical protein